MDQAPRYAMVHFMVCVIFCAGWLRAAEHAPCQAPAAGPAWFSDLNQDQKDKIQAEWEVKDGVGVYELEGKYSAPADEGKKYKRLESNYVLEAKEKWKCLPNGKAEFSSIEGSLILKRKWEAEIEKGIEKVELEDKYQIRALDDFRQVEHEYESETTVSDGNLQKETEEEEQWRQTWDKEVPTAKGKYESKTVLRVVLGDSKSIAGFRQRYLASSGIGDALPVEKENSFEEVTELEGRYDGPIELKEVNKKVRVRMWANPKRKGDPSYSKTLEAKENRRFEYRAAKKNYEFVEAQEVSSEEVHGNDGDIESRTRRAELWPDLNKPPQKTLYWQESRQPAAAGFTHSFTLSSEGENLLPAIFGSTAKSGSYSRITEFNPNGDIARFLVLYFPPKGGKNTSLVDLHFRDDGKLKSAYLEGAENESALLVEAPVSAPYLERIRKALAEVRTMENFKGNEKVSAHEADPKNYPNL